MTAIDVEQLLAHSDWLRALAARLVNDPATADDLVQETWLQALRTRDVAPGRMRPWLERVLRNQARNRWRSNRRRSEHELLVEAERANPTPAELAREAESQRLIAEAVARLSEPARSLIVLRYFRGLDSGAIGRMRGVPGSTVRGQLKRALEELRAELDREHGGREAWALLLLPILRSTPAASVSSIPLLGAVAALVVAVLASVLAYQLLPRPNSAPALATVSEPSAAPALRAPAALTPAPATEATRQEAGDGPPPSAREAAPVVLRGRFLDPSGAPLAGVDVELFGTGTSRKPERLYEAPAGWEDPSATTDEGGRFELSFAAPHAFAFRLRAKHPGSARDEWSWPDLLPGTALDLGDVRVRPGGAVAGVLRRADGSPVVGETWSLRSAEQSPPSAGDRAAGWESADVDPSDGSFLLEDLPPGPHRLSARSPLSGRVEGPRVHVRPGETTRADLVHAGPVHARRIAVTTSNELLPLHGLPEAGAIRIVAAATDLRAAQPVPGARSLFAFDDLAPTEYSIEIVDPRFAAWKREAVATGTHVRAQLVGSCGVELQWPAQGGGEVEVRALRLDCLHAKARHSRVDVSSGDAALQGGRLSGLVPGSYRLEVDGGAAGTRTVEVLELQPGERRVVELAPAVAKWGVVSGGVLRADGSPGAAVEVWLLTAAREDDSAHSPVLREGQVAWPDAPYRKVRAVALTDEAGAFAFELEGAGHFAVAVGRASGVQIATSAFELAPGASRSDLALTLPREGVWTGRVRGPASTSMEGLRVLFVPSDVSQESLRFMELFASGATPLDADGSFELEGLQAGRAVPHLMLPPVEAAPGTAATQRSDLDMRALTAVDLRTGANVRDIAVLEEFPGTAEVSVTAGGEPLAGVQVMLVRESPTPFARGRTGFTTVQTGVARILDFPGPRTIEVHSPAAGWRYVGDERLRIAPAETTSVQVEVELTHATLRVLDSRGRPLAGAAVQLTLAAGGAAGWVGEPRAAGPDGALDVTLVPGPYRCYLLAPDASDARAVKAARMSMYQPDSEFREASFTWSEDGAEARL
jgi:RNA polymerase sigma-70 factor (ECF subfamily)